MIDLYKHSQIGCDSLPLPKKSAKPVEPIFIMSLSYGYSLIKYPYIEPVYEIWLGSNSERDFLHRFSHVDEVAKYLDLNGCCADRFEAIKLLNNDGLSNPELNLKITEGAK